MGNAAVAGFGISAINGIAQHKQASLQADLDNATKAVNNQAVQQSLLSTYQSLENEADQVGENFISKSIDAQKMEAKSAGIAIAASGASGTGGSGLSMQMQDLDVESNMNMARSEMNKDRQLASIKSKGKAATSRANSQLNRMPDQDPKFGLSNLLEIGASGFRNTVALDKAGDAYDSVWGDDDPAIKQQLV